MSFTVTSLASSSSGNCYLIRSDNATVLLDMGISLKRIKESLMFFGLNLSDVDGILITHEHSDHVQSLKTAVKKMENAHVYMSKGTLDGIRTGSTDTFTELVIHSDRLHASDKREHFMIKDILVVPFNVSHDTNEPVMYSLISQSRKLSVVTDTGIVTDEIYDNIRSADTLIIESNHEPNILLYGSYPYRVKQRILSNQGHLSNEACAKCLVKLMSELRRPNVFLAHLSDKNNTPEQAKLTIRNFLEEEGYYEGKDIFIETLKKDQMSRVIEI